MIIDLRRQIEDSKEVEDLKPLLIQLVDVLNKVHDQRHKFAYDIELAPGTGILYSAQGTSVTLGDGHDVKMEVTGSGTKAVTLTDLGAKRSSGG